MTAISATMATPALPLLAVRGVKTYYGDIIALKGVDLDVNAGEIVAMIGANGAGKSTLMMTIFGDPQPREGSILFEGRDITGLHTHEIARLRISQAPEGRRIFGRMTVMENLQMGATVAGETYFEDDLARVFRLFPRLQERINQRGGTLSGGEQQMLAIGRALMSRPRLLLLDEPSLGLAPMLTEEIFRIVRRLVEKERIAVLLVEQNAALALDLADHGYVIETGRIVLEGSADSLAQNSDVKEFYLGLNEVGSRKSYHEVKRYRRRKRWLS